MKTLLIFPPQWMPLNPHFALATLLGQFEGTGYEAKVFDLNIDFYNRILTSDFVRSSYEYGKQIFPELKAKISEYYVKGRDFDTYTFKKRNEIAKASLMDTFFKKYPSINEISLLVEQSVKVLKTEKYYYNPKLFVQSTELINKALDVISMPYYPTKIGFGFYENELLTLDYDKIKYYVFDENTNIFRKYFDSVIDKIIAENANSIGISINSSSQIIAGLTLANMLKNQTNAHICIGGNHFGRVVDSVQKYPEFFELYCDSMLVEEGEAPIIELTEYLDGKRKIEEVSNLVYPKDGKVVLNSKIEPKKLNELKIPSLEGYDLKAYFTPEIVMPYPASRGCYWRKCSFCDHDFGMYYNIKNIDKLIDEIKIYKEKYGITKFEFIDEAISPKYMEEMSKRFIEEDLNVEFFCDARLEDGFTKEVCKLAYKAGLRMVLWGFESGSRKIMELINKGINIDNRYKILQNAHDAGIYNFAFIFFGFPAETKADAMETIEAICSHTDIIPSYGKSIFTMGKHTKLREAPEKYGVIGETKQVSEFSPTYEYEASGMTKDELREMVDLCTQKAHEAYGNALSFHLMTREILFLYLCRYGTKAVCEFKLEEN